MELLARQGLSFSLPDLYSMFPQHGWEMQKVKYDKQTDRFIASAKAPHGEEVEGWGPSETLAVSNLLHQVVHRNSVRSSRVAAWTYTFTDQLVPIAEAYAKAPVYEAKAAAAFMELARDCDRRAATIKEQLTVLLTNEPEPYKSADKLHEDVRKRQQILLSRAGIDHPLWSEDQVLNYRLCHDVLGFCAVNAEFNWEGENRAYAAHASVVPHEAQIALFSESVALMAYATYYRSYGPQKICLFPQFVQKAQEQENPHGGYRGIHPSQMFLPQEERKAKPKTSARIYPQPMANGQLPVDINAGYQTEVAKGNIPNGQAIMPYNPAVHGDYLGLDEMRHLVNDPTEGPHEPGDLAQHGLNTGWADGLDHSTGNIKAEWELLKKENPAEADKIYTAVSSAIRVAATSPRTLLHANAQHYQDLRGVPYHETDPNVYWNTLENARKTWNTARYGDDAAEEHRPWNQARDQEEPVIDPLTGQPKLDNDGMQVMKKVMVQAKDKTGNPKFENGKPVMVPAKEPAPIMQLAAAINQHDPSLNMTEAWREAQRMVMEIKTDIQHRLMKNLKEDPEFVDRDMWILDNEANKETIKAIKTIVKGSSSKHDRYQPSADEADEFQDWRDRTTMPFQGAVPKPKKVMERRDAEGNPKFPQNPPSTDPKKPINPITYMDYDKRPEFAGYENHKVMNTSRYQAFMGTAMITISQLTKRLDDIVVAALTDVHDHNGQGYHFRTFILSLNLPGVGPKIISFMWLLLQPLTSELATIDVHMAKLMGYDEKDVTDRDYFRIERELMARRDALGLGSKRDQYSQGYVPLGQFQWATWDMGRSGVGDRGGMLAHQPHSFMRVLNPVNVGDVPILPKPAERGYNNPMIQATQWAADLERKKWEEEGGIADANPQNQIPTQATWPQPMSAYARVASLKFSSTPWAIHPTTGVQIQGQEGQTLMQHLRSLGLSVPEIWSRFPDGTVGKV